MIYVDKIDRFTQTVDSCRRIRRMLYHHVNLSINSRREQWDKLLAGPTVDLITVNVPALQPSSDRL